MRGVLFVKIVTVVIIICEVSWTAPQCDMEKNILLDEGNMGHTSDFRWLGLLHVFLDDGDATHVAVTGLILVRADRALVSADDVERVPRRILRQDSRAVFIAEGAVAVNYSVLSYVTHPEYEADTFNSLAIILLDITDHNPLHPVCFPKLLFDADYLYLTGFTDENEIIEKMIYRIRYTDRLECENFYEKEGLIDKNRQPVSYICGKGWSSTARCLWDTGMALVSNSSGWFTLVGFSIHGPGCSAPSRFLSMLHYDAWIRDVTGSPEDLEDQDYISPDYRRTDGFDTEFVPIHRTFAALRQNKNDSWYWPPSAAVKHDYVQWPFPSYTLNHWMVQPSESDEGVIEIYPFDDTSMFEKFPGDCDEKVPKILMYVEEFYVNAKPKTSGGSVTYKLSMYDLFFNSLTCVKLEMDCGPSTYCDNRSSAYLAFKEVIDMTSETNTDTPEDIVNVVPIYERGVNYSSLPSSHQPRLRPTYIEYTHPYKINYTNYDLWIKFYFKTKGYLKFQLYGTEKPDQNRNSRRNLPVKHIRKIDPTSTLPLLNPDDIIYSPRRSKMRPLWFSSSVHKSVKDALVVEQEAVVETVGGAPPGAASPGVVAGCLLILACSRSIFI